MKYKVGDYLAGHDTVFYKIVGAIDGPVPVYAATSIKEQGAMWFTENEFTDRKIVPTTPDWRGAESLQVGDVVNAGCGHANHPAAYITVLARVGDAMLFSQMPDPGAHDMLRYVEHMEKQHNAKVADDDQIRAARDATNTRKLSLQAGDWVSTTEVALMNWVIVKDEAERREWKPKHAA